MNSSLNDRYRFAAGFEKSYLDDFPGTETVDFPHCPVNLPEEGIDPLKLKGTWSYRREFDCPDASRARHFLNVEGAGDKVEVYINGYSLGVMDSRFYPIRFELTGKLQERGNVLILVVTSDRDPSYSPYVGPFDYLTSVGIYRGVNLETRPNTYIKDLFAYGDGGGTLRIRYEIDGEAPEKIRYELRRRGVLFASFEEEEKTFAEALRYRPEAPELYELSMIIEKGGETDVKTVRVGFRDAYFKKEGFYLNGTKRFLVGLNRHQTYPYVLGSMPEAAQYEDAYILKRRLGLDVVRTSHYHDCEAFLNACDELGLLVISEVPGWQFISKDEEWRNHYYEDVERLVKAERNHPCLIAYGVRIDESPDDHDLYKKGNEIAHSLDPYRATIGVRNFPTSECLEDVYGFNDFLLDSLDRKVAQLPRRKVKGAKNKPLLITEHSGHMFPASSADQFYRQGLQGLRHLRNIDAAKGNKDVAGCLGWCAFDYPSNTGYGDAMRIDRHGVMDQFRNAKESAFAYAAECLDIPVLRVVADFAVGAHDATLYRPIIIFSNCDYIEMYRDGALVDVFYPDKKHYPNLKHPPYIIEEYVPASFRPDGLSKKAAAKLRVLLGQLAIHGANIGKKERLRWLPFMLRHGITKKKLEAYYQQAMGGYIDPEYSFKGYKNGLPVIDKSFGPVREKHLFVDLSKDSLGNMDTYDVLRVTLRAVDQHGTTIPENTPVVISLEGPIEIIGPSVISFVNGRAGFYIRSQHIERPSVASIKIRTRFEEKEEVIKVY